MYCSMTVNLDELPNVAVFEAFKSVINSRLTTEWHFVKDRHKFMVFFTRKTAITILPENELATDL